MSIKQEDEIMKEKKVVVRPCLLCGECEYYKPKNKMCRSNLVSSSICVIRKEKK